MIELTDEVLEHLDKVGEMQNHFEQLSRTWWVPLAKKAHYREVAKDIGAYMSRLLAGEISWPPPDRSYLRASP